MLLFLVYHRITESRDGDFRSIHPETLRRHLDDIVAAGIPVIDPGSPALSDLASGVALSFDDATIDHFAIARPLLSDVGLPGLFFVPTARLDSDGYLSTRQLAILSAEGHTIGSHSHTHRRFDLLPEPAVRHELETSRSRIQEILGRPPLYLAPPGGLYRASAITIAEQVGYRFFRTMKWGFNRSFNAREIQVVPMVTPWSELFLDWALRGRHEGALKLTYRLKTLLRGTLPERVYKRLISRWLA